MNKPEENLAELIYNKLALLFATEADPDIRRTFGIALLNDLFTSRDTYWKERVDWLDRIAHSYLNIEKDGDPNEQMKAQIHGFKQVYNIVKSGKIDEPLSLTPTPITNEDNLK